MKEPDREDFKDWLDRSTNNLQRSHMNSVYMVRNIGRWRRIWWSIIIYTKENDYEGIF